jgi:dUTP pyrophosphatase
MTSAGLDRNSIAEMLESNPPLIEGYPDLAVQLQPNGFDLTLAEVAAFSEPGILGETNAQRFLAEATPLSFAADGMLRLEPGAYRVTFNETVNLPLDIMTLGQSRSSLLRSGVAVHGAVGDAGYRGRYQALMVVYHQGGFTVAKNARVMQLVFLRLEQPATEGYQGRFLEGNPL